MAEKHNPDQMPNPYPPYGASNGPVAPLSVINAQQTSNDPNDIYALAPHVEISFDDTFKEPSAIQGFAFMKTVSPAIYQHTHSALYATLTLIISPIMSCAWAIFFAITHIFIIWFIQPFIKMIYISLRVCTLVFDPLVRAFFDPLSKSLSLVYSNIRGQFRLHSSDVTLNVKTIQV